MENTTFSYNRLVVLSNMVSERIGEIETSISRDELKKFSGYLTSLNVKVLKTTFKDDKFYKTMEEKYRVLLRRIERTAKTNDVSNVTSLNV